MGRKGKYSGVIDKLPRMVGSDPDHADKVAAVKRLILEGDPADPDCPPEPRTAAHFASRYADVRRAKDELSKQEKELNVLQQAYTELLIDQYEAEGIHSLELEDGGTVRVQSEPYARVEDKDKLRDWAINTCQCCGHHKDYHQLVRGVGCSGTSKMSNEFGVEEEHPCGCRGFENLERELAIPWQTVNSITKQALLDGQPPPAGVQAVALFKPVFTK